MFKKLFSKKEHKQDKTEHKREWPTVEVTMEAIERAIHKYHAEAPKGASLQVLVNDDASLDYELLAPYLHGIPSQKFYMSKETFQLFEEPNTPLLMDKIQRAVDRYIGEYGKAPIIEGDPYYKISYLKLADYINHERPDMDFYLTSEENLITNKKPS